MAHPYPPHRPDLPYTGKHDYFLTFTTEQRARLFTDPECVRLAEMQILRASREHGFELAAYYFMPDHLHLVVGGLRDDSDCKAFIKAAKQYSGYYFTQRYGVRLWQRFGFERVIRSDHERAFTIGYVVANPVRARLVEHPLSYPYLGSQCYSRAELLELCEYSRAWVESG